MFSQVSMILSNGRKIQYGINSLGRGSGGQVVHRPGGGVVRSMVDRRSAKWNRNGDRCQYYLVMLMGGCSCTFECVSTKADQ